MSRASTILSIATIIGCLSAAPAFAQSDQQIVLSCNWVNPGAQDHPYPIILDLGTKRATILYNSATGAPNKFDGPISEVSDAEVVWQVSGRSPNGLFAELDTYTLNRYSGQLSVDRSFSNGMNTPQPPVICQKSQKQF